MCTDRRKRCLVLLFYDILFLYFSSYFCFRCILCTVFVLIILKKNVAHVESNGVNSCLCIVSLRLIYFSLKLIFSGLSWLATRAGKSQALKKVLVFRF